MRQIVCLATSPWYPIPTRKQQVMSRIPDAEILYFDPSVTYLAPLRDRSAWRSLRKYREKGVHPQENITVYALPPVFPFFSRFRWINRINQKRMAVYVRRKMKMHGFETPLLWVYSPVTADLVSRVPHSGLVYDCVDRHSAYGGLMNPQLVDTMEEDLARSADRCFATAESLAQRLERINPRTEFIPNGANYERFRAARDPQQLPEDMTQIPGPIFGFVGALQSCIEYGYVEYAAQKHPEWSFVWIGREKPGVNIQKLRNMKNQYFLGIKPNESLPQYIAHFDVCLNLFAESDLSKDVSPLKFFEYLATGKPIVSTPQPDQILQYENLIHIAASKDEFVSACAEALADTDSARAEMRCAEGRNSSWDARVARMCNLLESESLL